MPIAIDADDEELPQAYNACGICESVKSAGLCSQQRTIPTTAASPTDERHCHVYGTQCAIESARLIV
ncbi:hypothetical protein NHH03_14045 [Stieleria sp. TO1_6]|uniref:hypothetical protein n=1 Tax=Stieleria tagensis TaxID=2956795 RepID=UPI00209B3E7B|nr:hypothetical protein [Stieleria tagensis]MCO8122865.1 hypothetical protein [Stieleria tagensis]